MVVAPTCLAMTLDPNERVQVIVLPLSGEVVWGLALIDANCTGGELCSRIYREAAVRQLHACPTLLHDHVELGVRDTFSSMLDKANVDVLLHVVWSPVQWPVQVDLLRLLLEPVLEPFLERPPRWKQLRVAPTPHVCRFARGFLKHVKDGKGVRSCLLMEMLGLPEDSFQALPYTYKQRLGCLAEGAASSEDRNEGSLTVMIETICALASDPIASSQFGVSHKENPRKLREWPTRRDLRKAVAMLVAAQLWEPFAATELVLRTDDVIQAATRLFVGRPDFAEIRRCMLELGVLRQKSVSPSNFELDAELSQKCLLEVLGLRKADFS